MPWSLSNPSKERVKFALEWEKRWDAGEGRMNMTELCREYGISRETGYVWLRRYRASGHKVEALEERSHRPHSMPNQVPQEVVDFIVAARKYRPTWGPRKLRLERFHRTLAQLVEEPAADVRAQQRAFDLFRHEYNHVRPHEALKLKPPLSAYEPAPRRYPRKLVELEYPYAHRVERIDKHGCIRWYDHRVLISTALAYEHVSVDQDAGQDDDHRWTVRWGEQVLGWLDERKPERGLSLPRRRRR